MAEIAAHEILVRQVTHWQPTFTYTEPGKGGTYTFQLILDEGADEFVLTIEDADEAENVFDWLSRSAVVHFDLNRRVLLFGTRKTGQ